MKKFLLSILMLLPLGLMAQETVAGGYRFSVTRGAAVTVEALHGEAITAVSATATGRGSNGTTSYQTNIAADKGIAVSGTNLTNGVSTTYTVTVSGIPAGTEISSISVGTNAMNGSGGNQADGESRTRFVTILATVGGVSTNVVSNVNTEFNSSDAPAGGSAPESYNSPFARNAYALATPIVADGGDLAVAVTVIGCQGTAQSDAATKGVYVTFKELTLGVEYLVGGGLSEEYQAKLAAVTAAYAKMVAPGDFVKAEGNYFVTADEKATVYAAITGETEEAIDAAVAVVDALSEAAGIAADNLYLLNNNIALTSGTIFVNSENILRGTVEGTDPVTDGRDKWMIVAKEGELDTYMLYNIGADAVANSTEVAAADAGGGPADAWTAISTFDAADQGYVVMEQMNEAQWRIRDSQVEGLDEDNKNTLRCYMNCAGGSSSAVTVWQQNGTPNGNANSLFNLCYMGKASSENIAAAAAMMQKIEQGGGVETGIAAATATAKGQCHDMSGRRVMAPAKGLYIVNGHKLLVK